MRVNSGAFLQALRSTGYLNSSGSGEPGLVERGSPSNFRLRTALEDERIGLEADAAFVVDGWATTSLFKDAGSEEPSPDNLMRWYQAAWNLGVAPLLWIITPTTVKLYNCYAPGQRSDAAPEIDSFALSNASQMRRLDESCGRLASETGAFWSGSIGSRIDRRYRVDRELLEEIRALESRLVATRLAHARDARRSKLVLQDFAQRVISRTIFASYLFDRGIIGGNRSSKGIPHSIKDAFRTVPEALDLFGRLADMFNGDLFDQSDDIVSEILNDDHLSLLRYFIDGTSLVEANFGQQRFFRFHFDAIPIELISSIYEQFARNFDGDSAKRHSLHYTPIELVHLTLDPVFEGLSGSARVIDLTCGSGVFLVESFRRLVWRQTGQHRAERTIVRAILYEQLVGVDINPAALRIAAFSMYLAALELDSSPIADREHLRFSRLIGRTLHCSDALDDALGLVGPETFDAVVGNPPWTYAGGAANKPKPVAPKLDSGHRRSPDQQFLKVALMCAGRAGRIGMVLKASPFFSRDKKARRFRDSLLADAGAAAIVNLSQLRRYLFADAQGPALLFFARCKLMPNAGLLVGNVPWTRSFERSGVFQIGPEDFRTLSLKDLDVPEALKSATIGSTRDRWLIEALNRKCIRLGDWLQKLSIESGQGFQVEGGDENRVPDWMLNLPVLRSHLHTSNRIAYSRLRPLELRTLHRIRRREIFTSPVVISPKSRFSNGRLDVVIADRDILYDKNFFGISFAHHESLWAYALGGILKSSLTTYQLVFGAGGICFERLTTEPNDIRQLWIPALDKVNVGALKAVAEAERAVSAGDEKAWAILDEAVLALYELSTDERTLVNDGLTRSQWLLGESVEDRSIGTARPSLENLHAYANEVVRVVNRFLLARSERRFEAEIFARSSEIVRAMSAANVAVVRFTMIPEAVSTKPTVHISRELASPPDPRLWLQREIAPHLNERRQVRIYDDHGLFVVKPDEFRYWTRTAGLNDADAILGDHWNERGSVPG
jgi:hypothetical protein